MKTLQLQPGKRAPKVCARLPMAGMDFYRLGLYSLLGRHEWAMHLESIPHARYFELMKQFNPTRFNAAEWADLMLEAGQKFLLITTKHHDGFCLWTPR